METQQRLCILDLPPYSIVHIFKYLSLKDLLFSVRNTCLLWNQLSRERLLWRSLDVIEFPDFVLTPKSFLDLLRDICESVECLHFDLLQHDLKIIKHEGTVCPNLKEIQVGYMKQKGNCIATSTGNDISTIDVNNGLLRLSEKYPNVSKLCLVSQVLLFEDIFSNLEEFVYLSVDKSIGRIRAGEFLRFHPSLKHITLRNCILSFSTVTTILTNYSELETLDLCGSTSVFDEINDKIDFGNINVGNLKRLNISETDIGDRLLQKIAQKASDLLYLDIANCHRVTNAAIEIVAKYCVRLKTLIINVNVINQTVGQCDITCAGIERITENCHSLTILKINHCPEVGDSGIFSVAKACHELTELEVAGCLSLQDVTVLSLVKNCPHIRRLNLGDCPQLTSKSVSSVLKHCRYLKYMSIETCHRVTDLNLLDGDGSESTRELDFGKVHTDRSEHGRIDEPKYMAVAAKRELENQLCDDKDFIESDISEYIVRTCEEESTCSESSSEEYFKLPSYNSDHLCSTKYLERLQNHSHVTVLNLSFCSRITNSCMKQIAWHCADLRDLDIQACCMVTNAGVRHLLQQCKFLEALNISGGSVSQTSRVTDSCLLDIVKYGRSLKKLMIVKNYNITADGVFRVVQDCEEIHSVSVEVSKRSNISKETLIELSGRVNYKTICLQFRAYVEILVFKDAEFKLKHEA